MLYYTSHLFVISWIVLTFLVHSNSVLQGQAGLFLWWWLSWTCIYSLSFWSIPIQFSQTHVIDSVIAKYSIRSFIVYSLFYQNMSASYFALYIAFLSCLVFVAVLGHRASSTHWLSPKHQFFHALLHTVCFFGTFFAYIEPIPIRGNPFWGRLINIYVF